jgi:hypothetical protein
MKRFTLLGMVAIMMGTGNLQAAEPVGARIQRTMRLLATSTPEHRNPVRILFYGQSIVRQDYARKAVEADLRKRFPNADLQIENRAIGGYTAPALIRTAEQDLYPFYPDLVVFHVYGGQRGEFEGILRNIRQKTTAEILTWTHHIDRRGPEQWDAACKLRQELAEKYQCEMVDLRAQWADYMAKNQRTPEDLTVDVVHLNKEGGKLMGDILVPAFQYHEGVASPLDGCVKTYPLATALNGEGPVKLSGDWRASGTGVVATKGTLRMGFTGNRVDLTSLASLASKGTVKVLIDGKAPSATPAAYAATLPTKSPIDYRPALKLVGLGGQPQTEDWTLTAHEVSEDGKQFAFDLVGSKTGPDGSGSNQAEFVSNSGRIRLQPRDFSFAEAIRIRKKPLPATFDVTWRTYLMGMDTYAAKPAKPGYVDRQTLVQGIPNAEHTLELVLNGDGPVALESLTIHTPPLK